MSEVTFPVLKATNLSGNTFTLPHDFAGELNLLFIAFLRQHQQDVDSWVPAAQRLAAAYPGLNYYELPVIRSMNFLSRAFIDGGMRIGIADRRVYDITITLYLDKRTFRAALEIPSEQEITVMLVDRDGNVHWRDTGSYSAETGAALRRAVSSHFAD